MVQNGRIRGSLFVGAPRIYSTIIDGYVFGSPAGINHAGIQEYISSLEICWKQSILAVDIRLNHQTTLWNLDLVGVDMPSIMKKEKHLCRVLLVMFAFGNCIIYEV